MSATPTPIPDTNTVAGIDIVTGSPIQDDDLLVFKTALNGWVFEQAGAIGVTLANLSINVDKDWLGRTINNIGNLSFNKGTAFEFDSFAGSSVVEISPLLSTPALTGLNFLFKDRNSATIERLVEYKNSRVLDKITQEATTASLVALYQMEAVIETSNDVVAADAVVELSLVAGTDQIMNRSLFQINNLLTAALELKTDSLEVVGKRVFTTGKIFNLFIGSNQIIATNTTGPLLDFEFSQLALGNGAGICTIDLSFATTKATPLNFKLLVSTNGATPVEIREIVSLAVSGTVQQASASFAFLSGVETFTFFIENPSGSGGTITIFGNVAATQEGHSRLAAAMIG